MDKVTFVLHSWANAALSSMIRAPLHYDQGFLGK
jgi:hypothetical protein